MNPEGPPAPMLFIAPRSQWTRLDDWGQQLGMKGSGSHTVRFENAVIPDRFVKPGTSLMEMDVCGGTPGLRLHGNPLYAGSSYSFFLLEAAAVCTGIAKNGLAAFDELMAQDHLVPADRAAHRGSGLPALVRHRRRQGDRRRSPDGGVRAGVDGHRRAGRRSTATRTCDWSR